MAGQPKVAYVLKRYPRFKALTTAWVQACLALARSQGFRETSA